MRANGTKNWPLAGSKLVTCAGFEKFIASIVAPKANNGDDFGGFRRNGCSRQSWHLRLQRDCDYGRSI